MGTATLLGRQEVQHPRSIDAHYRYRELKAEGERENTKGLVKSLDYEYITTMMTTTAKGKD